MSRPNHVRPVHSPIIRLRLLVGLATVAAVHLLAVGAVGAIGHSIAGVGPLALTNPLADQLIGALLALALLKLGHLLLPGLGASNGAHS